MALKKAAKRSNKKKAHKSGPEKKITLPAFGLAEDILAMTKEGVAKRKDEKASESPPTPLNESGAREDLRSEIMTPGSGEELHLVTFRVDAEEYGVDITRVQEIIRVGHITSVPNAPVFVKGVINLRGRIIPVLNLRRRLELSDAPLTKNSRIMIVETERRALGMLVDSVSQVLRVSAGSVETPPEDVEQARAFVRGIGKVDSRLIMIMELEKVLEKGAQPAAA